jgi:long-chain acyl-CoA synthetase
VRHPKHFAKTSPDKIVYQMIGSGKSLTFAELESRANQSAHALRALGLSVGDHIAFLLENRLEFMEICWAAQRSGTVFTAISRYLTADEATYIAQDCGAKVFITSDKYAETGAEILGQLDDDVHGMMVGKASPDSQSWEELVSSMPTTPIDDECAGIAMLYSSGTTGRPKGIVRAYEFDSLDSMSPVLLNVCEAMGKMHPDSIYLSPAPLYHSAPLGVGMVAAALGTTTMIMERFDAEELLAAIEKFKITHTQVVPTMFVRALKLPEETRKCFDVSTLTCAIHVAAPCPVEIKRAMIDWWGPILLEYYAGTEGNGVTAANSEEWLTHPGTVGKALFGKIRILDDHGKELPTGDIGDVYFDAGLSFSYHGDDEKTANSRTKEGWSTLGDIGKLDEDGFLYLADRRAYTIISGGVNIYPQECEDLLITHPQIIDAAVFGVPDEVFGEAVKAVVQPMNFTEANDAFEAELIAWCREHLSVIKAPQSIDFRETLPRTPTGKLIKRHLKAEYWPNQN